MNSRRIARLFSIFPKNYIYYLNHSNAHVRNTTSLSSSNSLVKRFNREIKLALSANSSESDASERLLILLFANRISIEEDFGCSNSDLVFGIIEGLPGDK